ncbi:hypothetical protein GCM10022243_49650 [Saccharothrix violaceirubra]|uniref:Aminoglycoside phosphotransferase (APT) family kinase protein n=1 Tax=Saccharothrix violaceirubra TaxID=413306 RepID=A0A7W7WU08_9PSEU|nr:phosphotransferase [Saccharothrix violaceirubra]MBB4963691.1 aminoglycoside phosphotransferase (APT) family kinase protein [Saccharothrix violaceirubra]
MNALTHGYTNLTEQRGSVVRKSYLGPDAEARRRTERSVLVELRDRFPVPPLSPGTERDLRTAYVRGVPGRVAVDAGLAERVLALCGRLRRELDALDVPGLPGTGAVVHGDFGPQNLIVTPTADAAVAVVDWEWCRRGDPVDDLAWAEWTVRLHHPDAIAAVDALYAAYGRRAKWSVRHEAMMATCHRNRDFCARGGDCAGVAVWDDRIARTAGFRDR